VEHDGKLKFFFFLSLQKLKMECGVCFEEIATQNSCTLQRCKHIFHSECLQKWFALSARAACPLCRSTDITCNHAENADEHNSNALLRALADANIREARSLAERVAFLEQRAALQQQEEDFRHLREELSAANERVFTIAAPHAASDSE
jgi:hypothetical protein